MNPLAVDAAAARFMGLTVDEIPQLKQGFELPSLPLFEGETGEIPIQGDYLETLQSWSPDFRPFRMPRGWQKKQTAPNTAVSFATSSSRCE
jgi:hypothetical protein